MMFLCCLENSNGITYYNPGMNAMSLASHVSAIGSGLMGIMGLSEGKYDVAVAGAASAGGYLSNQDKTERDLPPSNHCFVAAYRSEGKIVPVVAHSLFGMSFPLQLERYERFCGRPPRNDLPKVTFLGGYKIEPIVKDINIYTKVMSFRYNNCQ